MHNNIGAHCYTSRKEGAEVNTGYWSRGTFMEH